MYRRVQHYVPRLSQLYDHTPSRSEHLLEEQLVSSPMLAGTRLRQGGMALRGSLTHSVELSEGHDGSRRDDRLGGKRKKFE